MSVLLLIQNTHAKTLADEIIRLSPKKIPMAEQCETVKSLAREIALADQTAMSESAGVRCFLGVTDDSARGKVLGHVQSQLTV
jgi:phosphoenolpyruvate carboxylase